MATAAECFQYSVRLKAGYRVFEHIKDRGGNNDLFNCVVVTERSVLDSKFWPHPVLNSRLS